MKSFGIFGALLIGLATSLSAAPIAVFNTGVCSGLNTNLANCQGGVGPLLNYGVADANYVFSGFSTTDLTEHALPGSPSYIGDNSISEWLTPGSAAGASFPSGAYTVTTTFNLTGFQANTLTLSLDIAADNDVVAALNGHTILSCTTGGTTCFSAFTSNHSISAGSSGFALAGVNTLTFTVTNETNPSPTALRVQLSGTADSLTATPEPGTLVLLGVGLAGLGLLRRKMA